LKAVPWEQVPNVYLDSYQVLVNHNQEILKGLTPKSIPELLKSAGTRLEKLRDAVGEPIFPDNRPGFFILTIGGAMALTLVKNGWTLKAGPGVFEFTDGVHNANPFEIISQLMRDELTSEGFQATCDRLGIEEWSLDEVVKSPEAIMRPA
jgi:hypothetical protein